MSKEKPLIILIRSKIFNMAFTQPNPPIGLGYLASYLENHGFKVQILDLPVINITKDVLIQYIQKKKPILVGITALSPYYSGMKELSLYIKKQIQAYNAQVAGAEQQQIDSKQSTEIWKTIIANLPDDLKNDPAVLEAIGQRALGGQQQQQQQPQQQQGGEV